MHGPCERSELRQRLIRSRRAVPIEASLIDCLIRDRVCMVIFNTVAFSRQASPDVRLGGMPLYLGKENGARRARNQVSAYAEEE